MVCIVVHCSVLYCIVVYCIVLWCLMLCGLSLWGPIVAVGGGDNWCPCGGTHVKRTSDIRRIVVDKIRVRKNVTKVNYQCE